MKQYHFLTGFVLRYERSVDSAANVVIIIICVQFMCVCVCVCKYVCN